MTRRLVLHGHFYQPPREDPWTGEVPRQPSAGEDHDWNARIARECYIPNGRARVEGQGAVVNNYEHLSFNFGPTLLSWYEKACPEDYSRLLEADRMSARRLGGHGNAIAQAYSHMILPLASPRDRDTQVRWGLADFAARFGRKAEALWLPETACDDRVLETLIDHGLKYAILSPFQAEAVRPARHSHWTAAPETGPDPRRVYRWQDPRAASRHIDLFFYHAGLSQAVAFGRLMESSSGAARRVEESFDLSAGEDQLALIATDGETYGHHDKFAEMGLAHLLAHEAPAAGLEPVNPGWYLARHHARWEVRLKAGPQGRGTAWSCAHGLGRWLEDCGCGAAPGEKQAWRAPLRRALDRLRAGLDAVFEHEGGRLLKDPWEARDAYEPVLREPAAARDVIAGHAKRGLPEAAARRALELLELQKFALFMYTSCGWFFSELSGLEAVQNLRYAARALELAGPAGKALEAAFLADLARAPSNKPEYRDGAGVYRALVRPAARAL